MASRFHSQSPFGAGLTEKGRDGGLLALGSVAVVMGSSWTRPDRLAVSSRLAKPTKSFGFMTCGRLYSYETLLGWLNDRNHRPAPRLWYNRRSAPGRGPTTGAGHPAVRAFPPSPIPGGGPPPSHGGPRRRRDAMTAPR
jgi:hypothetical protein